MPMTGTPSPVYSKSNPNAGGEKMSPRAKRLLIVISVVIGALVVAGSVWGGLSADKVGSPANGCVNVNVPGSTGAELIHKCGVDAESFCKVAFATSDHVLPLLHPPRE